MTAIEQILLGFQALRYTAAQLWRARLWVWAVPLAAIETAVIAIVWHAAHPLVSWFMAPLLLALGGADTLHYPRVFELLPALFARADFVIGTLVGAVAFGAATPAFAARFRGETVHPLAALGGALRQAPDLILVQLPLNALVFVLGEVVGRALAQRGGGGLLARVAPLALTFGLLGTQAVFFYAVALVSLERRSAGSALRAIPGTWRRGFLPALVVSLVTLIALVPLHLPGLRADLLVRQGRPELVGWLTLLQVGAGLLNAFVLTGAATLLYLSALRTRDEDA